MPNWHCEQLRLTVFPTQDPRDPDPQWWRKTVGEEPETKTVKKGVAVIESGTFRGKYCELALEIQAARVDWRLSAVIKPEELSGFPTFDEFDHAIETYRELLAPWVERCPPIKRMAVGAILVSSVQNRIEGYKEIAKFLRAVTIDPENSSDFSYSINRPRTSRSGTDALKINRLSRWSIAQFSGVKLLSGSAGNVRVAETQGSWHACRLEIDVNTDAERADPLPQVNTPNIFKELISITQELAEKGDIP